MDGLKKREEKRERDTKNSCIAQFIGIDGKARPINCVIWEVGTPLCRLVSGLSQASSLGNLLTQQVMFLKDRPHILFSTLTTCQA
jgi:hypothetical protein